MAHTERVDKNFLTGFVTLFLGVLGISIAGACFFNFDRFMASSSPAGILLPFCLTFLGAIGAVIGGCVLAKDIRRVWRVRKLIAQNCTVKATVVGCISDWSHMCHHKPTHKLLLSWSEGYGSNRRTVQFHSHNLILEPSSGIIGKACIVYLNPNVEFEEYYGVFDDPNYDFCHYYVDVNEVMRDYASEVV